MSDEFIVNLFISHSVFLLLTMIFLVIALKLDSNQVYKLLRPIFNLPSQIIRLIYTVTDVGYVTKVLRGALSELVNQIAKFIERLKNPVL